MMKDSNKRGLGGWKETKFQDSCDGRIDEKETI